MLQSLHRGSDSKTEVRGLDFLQRRHAGLKCCYCCHVMPAGYLSLWIQSGCYVHHAGHLKRLLYLQFRGRQCLLSADAEGSQLHAPVDACLSLDLSAYSRSSAATKTVRVALPSSRCSSAPACWLSWEQVRPPPGPPITHDGYPEEEPRLSVRPSVQLLRCRFQYGDAT